MLVKGSAKTKTSVLFVTHRYESTLRTSHVPGLAGLPGRETVSIVLACGVRIAPADRSNP